MPKLYYTPTSCGAASFIAAHTAGVALECETVDLRAHKTASGADFYAINPKGNVPGLVLDDGTVLNEGSAVLQWIADQARNWPAAAPKRGSAQARHALACRERISESISARETARAAGVALRCAAASAANRLRKGGHASSTAAQPANKRARSARSRVMPLVLRAASREVGALRAAPCIWRTVCAPDTAVQSPLR